MTLRIALPATLTAIMVLGSAAFAAEHPKISMARARAIALKTVPGATISSAELEHEKGGSGLRYSFDVTVRGQKREVGVDAMTGKVLENSIEGADPD